MNPNSHDSNTPFELRITADGQTLTVRILIDGTRDVDAVDAVVNYVEQAFEDAGDALHSRPIHAIESAGDAQVLSIRRHYRDRDFPRRFERALSARALNPQRLH